MNSKLHILGFLSISISLATTFLTINQKSMRWPIDIFILLLNLYIHHKINLLDRWIFTSVILILDLYGWYNWKYGGPNNSLLTVKKINLGKPYMLVLSSIFGVLLLYLFLIYLHSDYPFIGALRTVFSWIALWLATNKRQEHWVFWVVLNMLSVYLYIQKGFYFFSLKYIIYIILNFYGFYKWQKSINSHQ